MKKLFVALAMLFVIANAAAVTVSITATNNGNAVSVSHYYSTYGDASYKAEGKGEVSYGSVDVSENFKVSGEAEDGEVVANHLAEGKDYAVASSHAIIVETGGGGKISESGSINANDKDGSISKDVNDEGDVESIMVAAKNNVRVDKKVSELDVWDLYGLPEERAIAGADNALIDAFIVDSKVNGKQSVATGSASASQSLEFSSDGGVIYAWTEADKDSNGDGKTDEWCDSVTEDYSIYSMTGQRSVSVTQSASTSTGSSSQKLSAVGNGEIHFTSVAAKDTDYDGNINEYAQAGTYDVDGFSGMYDLGDWWDSYIDYSRILNAETSASTSNSASASMNVELKLGTGQSIGWLGLTAARDTNNDGTIDERADTYVNGKSIYQFNANGWTKVSDVGNREESYMTGSGEYRENVGSLNGYAYAKSGTEKTSSIGIYDINFMLHAWVDENGVPGTEASTNPKGD